MGKKTCLTYVELPKKYLAACLKVLVNTFCVCYMDFMLRLWRNITKFGGPMRIWETMLKIMKKVQIRGSHTFCHLGDFFSESSGPKGTVHSSCEHVLTEKIPKKTDHWFLHRRHGRMYFHEKNKYFFEAFLSCHLGQTAYSARFGGFLCLCTTHPWS